jgi:hypothetical protein
MEGTAMEDAQGGNGGRTGTLHGQIVEERYSYYRRCQRLGRNGQQCKAPAMKGQEVCYKHEVQAETQKRRVAMREGLALPPLVDLKSVQAAIWKVAKAIANDDIDEKVASEMLHKLQNASLGLRMPKRVPLPRLPRR